MRSDAEAQNPQLTASSLPMNTFFVQYGSENAKKALMFVTLI